MVSTIARPGVRPVVGARSALTAALVLGCLTAGGVEGQVVVGEAIEAGSGLPLRGVFVTLVDLDGRRLLGTLTDEEGRFRLTAPGPGRYALRADRIGYEAVVSASLHLGAGITSHRFELESHAIQLEGLLVEGRGRECRLGREDGTRVQALWEQVRVAMDVAVWTEQTGYLRLDRRGFERLVDPVSSRVIEEATRVGRTHGGPAFVARPAEELVSEGFVRPDGEGYAFFGLDAATITSDAFLDAHCFEHRAAGRGQRGAIGLAFEPEGSASAPGVRGVLWLDEETLELHRLEYTYTWLPWGLPTELFPSETEFRRLPSGAWIVQRWTIRMPQIRQVATLPSMPRPRHEMMAALRDRFGLQIKEEGAEVMRIYTGAGVRLPEPGRAALAGTVHDSVAGMPLDRARVRLDGTALETTTDARGRYRFDELHDGVYGVTFSHPALDRWDVAAPVVDVLVTRGELSVQDLAVPSLGTLLARRCEPATSPDSSAVVVGRVSDEATGLPVPGATVTLRTLADDDAGQPTQVRTDNEGVFRFCGVVPPEGVALGAELLGHGRAEVQQTLQPGAILFHEFSLDLGLRYRVSGRVLDAVTERPIAEATVRLAGVEAVTTSEGHFLLMDVPPGRHALAAEHLAYGSMLDSIQVEGPARTLRLDVRLARKVIALHPITVSVTSRPTTGVLGRVYDRAERVRALGVGTVLDREDIRRRNPARLTHILAEVPGVRVDQLTVRGRTVAIVTSTRAKAGFGGCAAMLLYLDGTPYHIDESWGIEGIDDLVDPAEIEVIEVYTSAAQIPAEFSGSRAGCGVIAVWTVRGA